MRMRMSHIYCSQVKVVQVAPRKGNLWRKSWKQNHMGSEARGPARCGYKIGTNKKAQKIYRHQKAALVDFQVTDSSLFLWSLQEARVHYYLSNEIESHAVPSYIMNGLLQSEFHILVKGHQRLSFILVFYIRPFKDFNLFVFPTQKRPDISFCFVWLFALSCGNYSFLTMWPNFVM